jgi:hypothetical protein
VPQERRSSAYTRNAKVQNYLCSAKHSCSCCALMLLHNLSTGHALTFALLSHCGWWCCFELGLFDINSSPFSLSHVIMIMFVTGTIIGAHCCYTAVLTIRLKMITPATIILKCWLLSCTVHILAGEAEQDRLLDVELLFDWAWQVETLSKYALTNQFIHTEMRTFIVHCSICMNITKIKIVCTATCLHTNVRYMYVRINLAHVPLSLRKHLKAFCRDQY